MRTITKDAPRSAFELAAPGHLSIGDRDDKRTPVSLVARTAEPIDHWYWGRFVHDLDGITHPDTIPVDYCHDQYEPIGIGNRFATSDAGLTIAGELIHFREGDRADEVATKGQAGVPYQASITFSDQSDDLRLEYIPEGAFGVANGREYEGPITIVRKSFLRGVALCLYGYDRHTQTALSTNPQDSVSVTLHIEDSMSKLGNRTNLSADTKPADDAGQDTTQEPASGSTDAGNSGDGSETAKDAKDAKNASDDESTNQQVNESTPAEPAGTLTRTELKAYIDLFGPEHGSQWALAGKPLAECHQLHAQHLQNQLDNSKKETADLQQRLASLSTGESDPVTFSTDGKDAPAGSAPAVNTQLAQNVGSNIARIAAGIKIPKSS